MHFLALIFWGGFVPTVYNYSGGVSRGRVCGSGCWCYWQVTGDMRHGTWDMGHMTYIFIYFIFAKTFCLFLYISVLLLCDSVRFYLLLSVSVCFCLFLLLMFFSVQSVHLGILLVLVLLLAHVKRFSVSRMRAFFLFTLFYGSTGGF